MAFITENTATGDGSTTDFSFTFPYINESDVKVTITDANGDPQSNTDFTFANATTLSFNTAPTSGRTIRIFRDTNLDNAVVTFFAGSAIRAEDLNDNQNQVLFSAQEVENNAVLTTGSTITGDQVFTTGTVVFEGATADDNETTLAVTDPTADRTITLPNADGHVALFTADPGSTTISATPAELNTLDGITASTAELNLMDGVTATTAELNLLDGVTSTTAELNILDGVTATAAELNLMDGVTATTAELNHVDGVTSNVQTQLDNKQPLDAELTELATMGSTTASALADLTQAEVQILDGATVSTAELNLLDGVTATTTELNHVDGVTSNVQTQLNNKQPLDAELTELATMASGTASALADLSQAEVQILDGATVTTTELNTLDGVTASSAELNLLDGVTATTAELNKLDGVTASTTELNALDGITSTVTELNLLDGVTATTAELNILDGVTATASELNQLDGNTLSSSSTDFTSSTQYPSAAEIDSRITARIDPIGGFEAIADRESFPNTAPAEGVLVSIANAGGLTVSASGVSTNGDRLDDNAVTINNFPSGFNSTTLDDGIGLLVIATSTAHTYDFHRVVAKNEDVRQLSSDINDFKARYRVGSTNPTTSLDEGDLFYNTGSDKMLVYDGSAWEEVQSIGEYFIIPATELADFASGTASTEVISNAPANASQIILSINGVIQEPNTGTSAPTDGFALDGSTIRLAATPPASSEVWGVIIGSTVNIGEPSAGTVSEAKLNCSNDPTNDHVLTADSSVTGGLKWAAIPAVDSDKIEEGNTSVECTDGGSNGTITFTTEGTSRMTINDSGLANITLDAEISGHSIGKGNNSHSSNVAFGSGALHAATSNARNNVAIGLQALNDVTDGDGNVGVGKTAGEKITTGTDNVAIGYEALAATTTGDSNVAVGAYSLLSTTGSENVSVGLRSLQGCTSGVRNIGIGGYALSGVTEGDNNIGIGRDAGNDITTGDENIIIGKNVGQAITTGARNVIIGGPTTNYTSSLSDTIILGVQGTERMRIDSSGRLLVGATSSSVNCKAVIQGNSSSATTQGILAIARGSDATGGVRTLGSLYFTNNAHTIGAQIDCTTHEAWTSTTKPAYLTFSTNDGAANANTEERMRIDKDGNVGIGTTSPDALLDISVTGAANGSTTDTLILNNDNNNSNDDLRTRIRFNRSGNSGSNTYTGLDSIRTGTHDTDFGISLNNGGTLTERFRFDSLGRFIINQSDFTGINSEADNFVIHGDHPTGMTILSGNGGNCNINFADDGDDDAGRIRYNHSSNRFEFYTNGNANTRVNILSGGEMTMGTSDPTDGGSQGQFVVQFNGSNDNAIKTRDTTGNSASVHHIFLSASSVVGSITTGSSATQYNTSSDYRLKENVVTLDGAIDRVKQLAPKRFNFKVDADTTVDGFLAHEAQTVVPEAVTGTKDQVDADNEPVYQGIDQSKLVPLLTAALQEAITKIETLETKVAALEGGE